MYRPQFFVLRSLKVLLSRTKYFLVKINTTEVTDELSDIKVQIALVIFDVLRLH